MEDNEVLRFFTDFKQNLIRIRQTVAKQISFDDAEKLFLVFVYLTFPVLTSQWLLPQRYHGRQRVFFLFISVSSQIHRTVSHISSAFRCSIVEVQSNTSDENSHFCFFPSARFDLKLVLYCARNSLPVEGWEKRPLIIHDARFVI